MLFISEFFSMQRRKYIRRILYVGIFFFLLYCLIFRRPSPQVFLTASHVTEYFQQKSINNTHINRIPRIIHQTWKTKDVPINWNRTVESVKQLNAKNFEYRLWTDDDMHKFVRQIEPDFYKHTFLTYPYNIQRVDAFRYVILYYLGGIYVDMDNGCRQSFETLLNIIETLDKQVIHFAAFPRTQPFGLSNDFMIATKGHPLFKTLISHLSRFNHNYFIDYLTVMLSAGPIYLSVNEYYFDQLSTQSTVRIMDEAVYSDIYIWHTPGSSWHRSDARIIIYIYQLIRQISIKNFYQFLVIFSFILLLFFYRCCWHRQNK